jgi:hypothetical protein
MITTGAKWFLGLGLVTLVLAAAYGWTTGGTYLGPVTLGYNGGVGDHLGYSLLVSIGLVSVFLGLISVAVRDADSSALAQLAGTETAPAAVPPAHDAYWPILGAFGVTVVAVGLVASNVLFVAGFFVLLAVLVEWMVLAWSDRATGDPAANRIVRDRLMGPFEVPLAGGLVAIACVGSFSRLFLTSSKLGAVAVAAGVGGAIFVLGAIIAARPRLSTNAVAGLLLVLGIGVVAAGLVAAGRGERVIEHHEADTTAPATADGGTTGTEDSGSGLRPHVPAGTQRVTTTTTEAAG